MGCAAMMPPASAFCWVRPLFSGAGLLQLDDALAAGSCAVVAQAPALVTGFVVSALVGFLAIRGLLAYLRRHSLNVFAIYCVIASLVVFARYLLG